MKHRYKQGVDLELVNGNPAVLITPGCICGWEADHRFLGKVEGKERAWQAFETHVDNINKEMNGNGNRADNNSH